MATSLFLQHRNLIMVTAYKLKVFGDDAFGKVSSRCKVGATVINRIVDEATPIQQLVADPVDQVRAFDSIAHPRIPLPIDLFGAQRKNSMGVNLANDAELGALLTAVNAAKGPWKAAPLVPGWSASGPEIAVTDPADRRRVVGHWRAADAQAVERAVGLAVAAQPGWDALPAASRATILEHAADLMEQRRAEFIALCTREAGKTIPDGIAEVREAVDFLRYYAALGRTPPSTPT